MNIEVNIFTQRTCASKHKLTVHDLCRRCRPIVYCMFDSAFLFVHKNHKQLSMSCNSLVSGGGSCNVSPRSVAILKLIEEK